MDQIIEFSLQRVSKAITEKPFYRAVVQNNGIYGHKELAERLGTKQTYIAALERGRKNITFSTLARYARACGKKVAVTLL